MAADIVSQANDTLTAVGAALSYTWGNCTRWVAENLPWIPAGLGNANQWFERAQARGLAVAGPTAIPPVGAVAVWNTGALGHVAEVVGTLPGGGIQVSEENWLGPGVTDIRNVTGSGLRGLQGFILPPGFRAPALPDPGQAIGGFAGQVGDAVGSAAASAAGAAATSVGHGIANAGGALVQNAGIALRNQLVPLVVALVVAIVLFGGDERQG